ncbi:cytoplasmic dynein 1 light intermediate chain 1-like [Ciona intestinalis]
MARGSGKIIVQSKMDNQKGAGSGNNVWSMLLDDVSSSSSQSALSENKSAIILGDDLSGKSTLTAKLQGLEETHRGSALDFQAMEVQEDEAEESGICRIWIVDGHLAYRSLLQFALPKISLSDTIAVITCDMSHPWEIPESLAKWTKVIHEHIDSLKCKPDFLEALKQNIVKDFQRYVDPTEADEVKDTSLDVSNDSSVIKPLGEITLIENLCIPLIVVCTKCDSLETLETEFGYSEEQFDFLQHYLRLFCLKHGASLVYTSMKENKNIEVLKKYLLHRMYGFPFSDCANVVDRDAVFVPAGWDSEKKLSIISDNLQKFTVNDPFESVIPRPPLTRKHVQDMKEVVVDDEQTFLMKAQAVLSKAPTVTKPSSDAPAKRTSYSPLAPAAAAGKGGKPDVSKTGASNERMLANFFNSLLNKKPGSQIVNAGAKGAKPNQQAAKPRSSLGGGSSTNE